MAAAKSKRKSRGGGAPKTKDVAKGKKVEEMPAMDGGGDGSGEGEDAGLKVTLAALEAMSDDDSDFDGAGGEGAGSDGEEGEGDDEDYDAEAEALRNMIREGKFDGLLQNAAKKKKAGRKGAKESDEAEKAEIDDGSEDGSGSDGDEDVEESLTLTDGDMEEALKKLSPAEAKQLLEAPSEEDDSSASGSDDSDSEEEVKESKPKQSTQALALTTAVQSADRHLPWAETFAVVPPTPPPFRPPGVKPSTEMEEGDEYVDVHDDLKREVAFHDTALEAALLARDKCEEIGIPFARPDDFFAEMVKSDDHMAKIKDRLIFETKKMEAVERRKSNKEQSVMAKERRAHRAAEKAKAKKAHLKGVEEWKRSAERGRGGLGGRVRDGDDDEARLGNLRGIGGGNSKKRAAADRKYGFGGKRGRFKQNDRKTLDDMSGYNPRGGFGGIGTKGGGGSGGKKGGKKRPGKRARDAARR